jgi:alpha,alpha-trehalose-phosphate synthase [UDP-forming]/trehalose-phosphatase
MKDDTLKAFINENPSLKNLIIVSNREPYIHKVTGRSVKVDAPVGGLTASLDEVMKSIGGTWVAWGSGTGDRNTVDSNDSLQVPPGNPSYRLRRVWLDQQQVDNYYHGYSNHVLWPLCHIALDRIYFRKKYWDDYKRANAAFAEAVLQESNENSIVWIHDYHLCLLPQLIREKDPEATIAHFWHIPWPDYDVFRICPQSVEILAALLRNDLVGFQLPIFSRNFLDCVKQSLEEADVDIQNSIISYKGHKTRVKAFPISVDFEKFSSLSQSLKTVNSMKLIKQRYNLSGKFIGLGVDRLEYTKALIKRLQAIDLFFERYPKFIGKFTFIQIAVPTRLREPYISYKALVEKFVRKINKKYSLTNWTPVLYRDVKAEHKDLVVFYRLADVAIISSVFDGMNLVAKEFVASRIDGQGTLLLSEFAGAAEELEGAILVNPYDVEDFADCIKFVLELPAREKISRMNTLRGQVKEKDIYSWIQDILNEVTFIASNKLQKSLYLFDHIDRIPKNNVFLFLDYDGTLTPIVNRPENAFLSERMHAILMKLNENIPIAIISGRSINDIKQRINIEKMIYAGNHGAEIWDGKKMVIGQQLSIKKKMLGKVIRELKTSLSFIDGTVIEDKGITASIHYRLVKVKDLGSVFNIFWAIIDRYEKLFTITSGKKVFEIRPRGIWNKGDAVNWIVETFGQDRYPIYIGDDTTDEDAFKVIKGKGAGISIGTTMEADYYLKNQKEVGRLLKLIDHSQDKVK